MHVDPTRRYRLLTVEDDSDCAALIVRVALRSGYEAFSIADAQSLRETISRWRPDVITLDLCLPGVDGLEVLAALKAVEYAGRVIIISGQPEWFRNQAVRLACAHGLRVPAQMSKPIEIEQLRELLATIRTSLFLSLNPLGSAPGASEQAPAESEQHH
jgi:DNA-binding response OmpR family regulator